MTVIDQSSTEANSPERLHIFYQRTNDGYSVRFDDGRFLGQPGDGECLQRRESVVLALGRLQVEAAVEEDGSVTVLVANNTEEAGRVEDYFAHLAVLSMRPDRYDERFIVTQPDGEPVIKIDHIYGTPEEYAALMEQLRKRAHTPPTRSTLTKAPYSFIPNESPPETSGRR